MEINHDADRKRWNEKYRIEIYEARVNENLIRYAHLLKRGRVLDLAGGLGQNGAWLAGQSSEYRVIDADIAVEGLVRAAPGIGRVAAEATALPFVPHCFDTVLNIRFFEPRVKFSELLSIGGTVFLETFSAADKKYRPDFKPAYLLPFDRIESLFKGFEILHAEETDDGKRVYVTVVARRP
jgi:hypothetical protein